MPLDLTDDIHHLGLVGLVAAFVDDGKVGIAEALRQCPGTDYAADVGRNHNHVIVFLLPDIPEQNWRCVDIIYGDIEKALDLVRVQIHGQDAIDACRANQLGHELRCDRHTRSARAPVLPRKAEVRDHRCDTRR